jgi:hypothetical protein
MDTKPVPELPTIKARQICQQIDSFTDWVLAWLLLKDSAPLSVQRENSYGSNRELVAAAHSTPITGNHAPMGVSSAHIFTEARKSTARLTY